MSGLEDQMQNGAPTPDAESGLTPAPPAGSASDADAADSLVLSLPDESAAPKDLALWAGLLMLLTLVVYWPTTNGSLLWNDARNVQAADVQTIWAQRWVDSGHAYPLNQYHPVAATLDRFLYTALGRDAHGAVIPFTFHLAALVLHCAAGLLLWLILRQLKAPGAWLAAALFLLHPLNTEAVAWISQMPAVLAGALCFGSIYCYLRFAEDDGAQLATAPPPTLTGCDTAATTAAIATEAATPPPATPAADFASTALFPDTLEIRWAWYVGAVVLFILGMLSKSTAWAMPVLTLAALWWRRRVRGRDVLLLLPMFLIAAILVLFATGYENFLLGKSGAEVHWSLGDRLIEAGRTFWFYLGKVLFPVPLSALYPRHEPTAAAIAQYLPLAAALLLAGILAAATRCGRAPIAALVAFAACILPASGLVYLITMRQSFDADHQAYLASAPIIVLVIGLLAALLRRRVAEQRIRNATAISVAAVLLIVAGGASWARGAAFRDLLGFWQDTVGKDPLLPWAHDQLAHAYAAAAEDALASGDDAESTAQFDAALEQVQTALTLDPRDAEAQSIWGRLLSRHNQRAQAIQHLLLATQLNPKLLDARQELGLQLVHDKQYAAAIAQLDAALSIQPQSAVTHRVLGEAFTGLGNDPRAISEEQYAVQIDPNDIQARIDLANLLSRTGDTDGAIVQMTVVANDQHAQNIDDPATWNALGRLFGRRGRPGDMDVAVKWFQIAVGLDPANTTDARKNLVLAQAMLAQAQRAATRPSTHPATTQSASTGRTATTTHP